MSYQPSVFKRWDDPLISGIGRASQLIEIGGGIDVSADRANQGAAKDRVVANDEGLEPMLPWIS